MESFKLERQNEHSAIFVNQDAQCLLEKAWSEINEDYHFYERSTWILQVVLMSEEPLSKHPQQVPDIALTNAQILNAPETWSCVRYTYAPDEICFIVFIHEPQDKPILMSEVERRCREMVNEPGWLTYVMPLHKKEGYQLGFRFLAAVEGRYKSNHL